MTLVVGWTGTRPPQGGFTPAELELIHSQVAQYESDVLVVTGGCEGVDAEITLAAHRRGLATRAVLPYQGVNTTAWQVIRTCNTDIVRTDLGFLDRDRQIVQETLRMHAIGLFEPKRAPHSGTWATARMAQRAGTLRDLIVLRPQPGGEPWVLEGKDWCLCQGRRCACGLRQLAEAKRAGAR